MNNCPSWEKSDSWRLKRQRDEALDELRLLRIAKDTIEEGLGKASTALNKTEAFLQSEGYVRCDIPGCNCESWHKARHSLGHAYLQDALRNAP